jgi:hypothetical protein
MVPISFKWIGAGGITADLALPQNPGPGYRFNTNTIYKRVNNTII